MPLTFLAHQAPVLPLKMRWPHLVDGTALVVGSMMPDLFFLTYGTGLYLNAHTVAAQLWLCLPLTLVITIAVKRLVAGALGPHLPDARGFHLRDWARLSAWPVPRTVRAWTTLVASALIGSFSHVALDACTHSWGFVVEHVAFLRPVAFRLPSALPRSLSGYPVHVYLLLQVGLSVVLSIVTIWLLHRIGRRRRLVDWYPGAVLARPTPTSRRRVLVGAVVGAAIGATMAMAGWLVGNGHGLLFLITDCTGLGIILSSPWARTAMVDAPALGRDERAA